MTYLKCMSPSPDRMCNMERRIEIKYSGGMSESLDEKIQKALESIGCTWYAQGVDLSTGDRDIAFDYEDEE